MQRILLFGDENFSFCNDFLAEHENDVVEVCSCLKENELKQEAKNNIQELSRNIVIHYGINPVQLKSKFAPNTFDVLYYILPGLSFHGYPDFIDPQTEMFKLRLNLFTFSFLKSSKNIIKPDGYVYLLYPEENQKLEGNSAETTATTANNETESINDNNENHVKEGKDNDSEKRKCNLPFLPIEPKKLAKFCNISREYSKDYYLNLSNHEKWLPVLFNMPIVNELPEWVKTCKYYCFKMTENTNNKNNSANNSPQESKENQIKEENNAEEEENKENENDSKREDEKRQDDNDEEQNENNGAIENTNKNDDNYNEDEKEKGNKSNKKTKENAIEQVKDKEDPDEYNVLKIPPQVFDYPIEKLGHVNECFLFKLYSVNSKSVLISRLTLKYDPRISGWKGDNKVKKDIMNTSMGMNMNNMNMMKNMNNLMNMNKFKGGKYKNKQNKNDFQQQYKNNMMQNNMVYGLNKKGNVNLPPPPPTNLNMQANNVNMPNQNMNYKQSKFPFVNNFKVIPNNLSQNVQSTMTNMSINVNPNISNNMMNPYINGGYNTNFRNNIYQQNMPIPSPMGAFNKK